MKTFKVFKNKRNKAGYGIGTKKVGTVTAYNSLDAMRKAVKKYNKGSWLDISVKK